MNQPMSLILFSLPENEALTKKLAQNLNAETGEATFSRFPDGESYVRIHSEVRNKKAILVCSLHKPDEKLLPLYYLSSALKEQGASSTTLIAPYLAYMRQDKPFKTGEGITARYFANLISGFADHLITVDPHLHRIHDLSEVYSIPTRLIQSASFIANWIKENIENPVVLGPDRESKQWVSEIAKKAEVPFTVLEKVRYGDENVEITFPEIEQYQDHTPVLVDDIISTAGTMIEATRQLKSQVDHPPVCIGIHAVFAGEAYENLLAAGAREIITCNTIPHKSNQIDITPGLAQAIES